MSEMLELWDWRRRVADMYGAARQAGAGEAAWLSWRRQRQALFAIHPQSPLDEEGRASFAGLPFYDYDQAWRVIGTVQPYEAETADLPSSSRGSFGFLRIGTISFKLAERPLSLALYWLDAYGGGVFLPFRDPTNGVSTYGGGRYLLDGAKGADLGHDGDRVVLDFNYAYNPSCAYDPRWSCPLAGAGNRVTVPINAGERIEQAPDG